MEKVFLLRVLDTFTNEYVEVEVSEEIYNECMRDEWRRKGKDKTHYKHEISSSYITKDHDSEEIVSLEVLSKCYVNPIEAKEIADEETERIATIHRAIETLKPEHREVIEALYFKGMTQDQFSEVSGIPQRTISHRKVAAIKNLKNFFKKCG